MSREEVLKQLEELGLDPTLVNEGVSDELLAQFLALAKPPKNEVPNQMNDLTRDEMIAALVEKGHSPDELAAMDDAALSALYDAEVAGSEADVGEGGEFADDEEALDEEMVGDETDPPVEDEEEVTEMAERDEMIAALVAAGAPQAELDALSDEEIAALFAQLQEMAAQEAAPAAAPAQMSERRKKPRVLRYSDVAKVVGAIAKGLEARLTRKFARTAKRANQLHRDTKHRSIVAFCERLQEEGRLLPAQFDRVVARLLRANDEKPVKHFSEGKFVRKTELELQMDELRAAPIVVSFSDRMKQPVGQHDGEVAQVEAHFEAFSETYKRLGQTKESLVKGFKLAREGNARLTAKEFCSGKG